jgi:hypothetical protein
MEFKRIGCSGFVGGTSDPHELPVVMESFAAVEAGYVHVPLGHARLGHWTLWKSGISMAAPKEQVIDRIHHAATESQ